MGFDPTTGALTTKGETVASASGATITVDTTARKIKNAAAGTKGWVISNNGAADVYLGFANTVVAGNTTVAHGGWLLKAGERITSAQFPNLAALEIWGITSAGSSPVASWMFA